MSTNLEIVSNFTPLNHTLEECLQELEKYGHPRVSKMREGWYAKLEVFVTGKGVSFDVNSEHDCKTPTLAVAECYTRLIAAVKKIKQTT